MSGREWVWCVLVRWPSCCVGCEFAVLLNILHFVQLAVCVVCWGCCSVWVGGVVAGVLIAWLIESAGVGRGVDERGRRLAGQAANG